MKKKKGGRFLAQGADTCVYDPAVQCIPGTLSDRVPQGNYVSRLILLADEEITNQEDVKSALRQIQRRNPEEHVEQYFNLSVASCLPQLAESDLRNRNGRHCTASMQNLDSVTKGNRYMNLITPKQGADMNRLPIAFIREHVPKLLRAIAFLNSEGVVHADAHPGNIAEMGGRLVLHDWGRATVGRNRFEDMVESYLTSSRKQKETRKDYMQWKFPCSLMDVCVNFDAYGVKFDSAIRAFMQMFDTVSLVGSLSEMKVIPPERAQLFLKMMSNLLLSPPGPSIRSIVLAGIDWLFASPGVAPPPLLVPYMPKQRVVQPPPPPVVYAPQPPAIGPAAFARLVGGGTRRRKQKSRRNNPFT